METKHTWFKTGREIFPAMVAAIDAAQRSVSLETYYFAASPLGDRFREALAAAARRGIRVRVLYDALGSYTLSSDYFAPVTAVGGQVRVFNPLSLNRLAIRDHRKVLVCDESTAFVGGFNIAPDYEGDGVASGWCDLGLRLEGPMAAELELAFDEMFEDADLVHRRLVRLRRPRSKRTVSGFREQLLLAGPGRGQNPIRRALSRDLSRASSVRLMVPYFLPPWRIRRRLMSLARRGSSVRLILPGKTDVTVSQLAAQSLYRRLLRSGIELFEYQPQILHAKLFILDQAVYVGSSNLDPRSFSLNYELMVRLVDSVTAAEACAIFDEKLQYCRPIELATWSKSRSFWRRLKEHWAYFLLARIDPYISREQWRGLPDEGRLSR